LIKKIFNFYFIFIIIYIIIRKNYSNILTKNGKMTDSREKPDIFYLKTKKEFGKFVYKVNLYLNLAILINFVIYS